MVASSEPEVAHGKVWALRAARVFDGETLHQDHPLVVIDGSRIAAIDRTTPRPSDDLHVLDLGDATLLPGLIDAHVHLAFDPDSTSQHQTIVDEDNPTILTRMRRHALQQLRAGVTTVRDLGDRDYLAAVLRDEYVADPEAGPEVIASGPPITRTRGHCWFLGGEADGVAGVQAAVDERATRGADVIKIMATGGATTPGWGPHQSQYTFEELAAATELAHALASATTVAAQACGIADRKGRIAAGYDADLLAVSGNPLDQLEALLEVRAVFRMGRRIRRSG